MELYLIVKSLEVYNTVFRRKNNKTPFKKKINKAKRK